MTNVAELLDRWNDFVAGDRDDRPREVVMLEPGEMVLTELHDVPVALPVNVSALVYRPDYYVDILLESGVKIQRTYPVDFDTDRMIGRKHRVGELPFMIRFDRTDPAAALVS